MGDTAALQLRPIERCVLRMSAEGLPDGEIGRRLGRSPEYAERMRTLTTVPRSGGGGDTPARSRHPLRPLERVVLRWRDGGTDYPEIATRFGRTPGFVERVEQLAYYKLAR